MAASTSAAAEAAAALPSKRSLNVEELKRKVGLCGLCDNLDDLDTFQVFTGPLPDDFLRLTSPYDPQQSSPERAAQFAAQQQQMLPQAMSPAVRFGLGGLGTSKLKDSKPELKSNEGAL